MGVKFTGGYKSIQLTKVSVPTGPDPFYNNVVLLIQPESGDTQITDKSQYNWSLTNNNVNLTSTETLFGRQSIDFNGTGYEIVLPNVAEFAYGSNDFTIEAWLKPKSIIRQIPYCVTDGVVGATDFFAYGYQDNLSVFAQMREGGTFPFDAKPSVFIDATEFYHIAVTKDSGTYRLFSNGLLAATVSGPVSFPTYTDNPRIGHINAPIQSWSNMWLGSTRITNGIVRYTTNFTPPTGPFPTN